MSKLFSKDRLENNDIEIAYYKDINESIIKAIKIPYYKFLESVPRQEMKNYKNSCFEEYIKTFDFYENEHVDKQRELR